MTITYHLGGTDAKGTYEGRATLRAALADAYAEAVVTDSPVTVFQADGEDDALVFTPLAVISALPIVSQASS